MVKIERSYPAPKSLALEARKATGSYRKSDVIEQLKKDFHNKCYICELSNLSDAEVEHLLPHKNGKYPERKFDWNNLFWACRHCNDVKNNDKYDLGIVNCCEEDPEKLMHFKLENGDIKVYAKDNNNTKAALTAQLVTEVFNLKNTGMRIYKSEMRFNELNKEMNKLYDALDEVAENPDCKFSKRKLEALLSRESGFAAFKRNYVRENQDKFSQISMLLK